MKKKWLKYIVYMVFVICFTFVGKLVLDTLEHYYMRLAVSVLGSFVVEMVLYIGFGLLMGLGRFIEEKAKEGKWKINSSKLIIIGIPSLILGGAVYLIFLFRIPTGGFLGPLMSGWMSYMILFKILFGYTVVTSLYKEDHIEKV